MYEAKTKPTASSVSAFLDGIADESRRTDCKTLAKIMKAITKASPRMWGASIVGFGMYHYKYASGHEGDCCLVGFAPRKRDLTIYIMAGFERFAPLMAKLGKFKTGKCCLYVKKLADVDETVLRKLIEESVKSTRKSAVSSS